MPYIQTFFKKHSFFNSNLRVETYSKLLKLFRKNNVNICYNKFIPHQYDSSKQNILLALESPAVIEYEKWISPNMNFVAEISFFNYMKLENYYCCRDLYVNADNFIDVDVGAMYENKPKLMSIISSFKKHLAGHKLRHEIIKENKNFIDVYGSGYGKFGDISNSYIDYMFQVVIENGKYPEYVSEKFFNCLKTQTVPIYWGGEEAVRKMGFNPDGVIFFSNKQELDNILKSINGNLYKKMRIAIYDNLYRLIELRNEQKLKFYLNSVMPSYMHTMNSYLYYGFNKLNLNIEKIIVQ